MQLRADGGFFENGLKIFFERYIFALAREEMHARTQLFETVFACRFAAVMHCFAFCGSLSSARRAASVCMMTVVSECPRRIVDILCDAVALFDDRRLFQFIVGVQQFVAALFDLAQVFLDLPVLAATRPWRN